MDPSERLNLYLALLQIRRKAGLRQLIFFTVLFFGLFIFHLRQSLTFDGNLPAYPQSLSLILIAIFLLILTRAIVNYEIIRGSIETVENLKRALESMQNHQIP